MCWSGEASTVMALIGLTGAGLEARKSLTYVSELGGGSEWKVEGFSGKHNLRAMTLAYFSLMELLQAFNYTTLGTVDPNNALYAFLGYIHISFQPLFITWFCLSFIPRTRRMYWITSTTALSGLVSFLFLCGLIINPSLPGCFAIPCEPLTDIKLLMNGSGMASCSSTEFVSSMGDWHIAWQWASNDCHFIRNSYFVIAFFLPLLYGSYRVMLYSLIFGPLLSIMLTNNPHELAAIWCLLSIGFLSGVKIPWLENFLTVKHASWKECFASLKGQSV
ncbi:MAG: hypothetical protein GQ581_05270 [Methyloprofundus sp.]|nr:hypothetical protein [Methyloprofundus sp.]